jgi:hypothetical protein
MAKKYRSDVKVVPDLVNRGRMSLGLEPLERLPKGIVDDPFEGARLRQESGKTGVPAIVPKSQRTLTAGRPPSRLRQRTGQACDEA